MAYREGINYKKPQYISTEDEKDIYSSRIEKDVSPILVAEERVTEQQPAPVITQVKRTVHPRLKEWKGPKSLNRKVPQVFGTLFDRVHFLSRRIEEIEGMIEERKKLREEVTQEIDKDIEHKEKTVSWLSDVDEKRNFKLDISILRRDRRLEQLQFWKDLTELRTELRTLTEELESERKIVGIFEAMEADKE